MIFPRFIQATKRGNLSSNSSKTEHFCYYAHTASIFRLNFMSKKLFSYCLFEQLEQILCTFYLSVNISNINLCTCAPVCLYSVLVLFLAFHIVYCHVFKGTFRPRRMLIFPGDGRKVLIERHLNVK